MHNFSIIVIISIIQVKILLLLNYGKLARNTKITSWNLIEFVKYVTCWVDSAILRLLEVWTNLHTYVQTWHWASPVCISHNFVHSSCDRSSLQDMLYMYICGPLEKVTNHASRCFNKIRSSWSRPVRFQSANPAPPLQNVPQICMPCQPTTSIVTLYTHSYTLYILTTFFMYLYQWLVRMLSFS